MGIGAKARICLFWCDFLPALKVPKTQNLGWCVIYFSVGFTNSYNHIGRATYNCGH